MMSGVWLLLEGHPLIRARCLLVVAMVDRLIERALVSHMHTEGAIGGGRRRRRQEGVARIGTAANRPGSPVLTWAGGQCM